MADRVSRRGKRKTVQFWGMFVWIIVFYFYNIFLTISITNGFKLFSKTNSTDPRQRVPLTCPHSVCLHCNNVEGYEFLWVSETKECQQTATQSWWAIWKRTLVVFTQWNHGPHKAYLCSSWTPRRNSLEKGTIKQGTHKPHLYFVWTLLMNRICGACKLI